MNSPNLTALPFVHLSWDTENFGFRVAKASGQLGDEATRSALSAARKAAVRLLYWQASPDHTLSADILADFGGRLVDRKVTFANALKPAPLSTPAITEHPVEPPSQRMIDLSIAAGWTSRYFVDPKFPRDKAESLYRIWIQRSTLREIADMVLASPDAKNPTGMITISVRDGIGNIGLIAVAPTERNRGLATALMLRGHQWMVEHGASRSTVVTQLDNDAACRLYRRFGYEIESVSHFYHFWL